MGTLRRKGALALGSIGALVTALAIAGAATANHWPEYNGSADSHELVDGNPPLCSTPNGGTSFRVDVSELVDGGEYPSGDPIVRITDLDVDGGTLSWQLIKVDDYDMAAVVMKGGPNAMVYYYDASGAGVDDSDEGITTPINTGGVEPRPYGISHVDFCLDPKSDVGIDDLEVTKTASASWEKVYTWDVEKSVDKPQLVLPAGGSDSVHWTVDVTQTGFVPRNAVVTGTITVANPNDADVTGVSVSDALPGAVVDCDAGADGAQNTGLTVPANGSISCSYSAARDTIDGGTNSASATGTLEGIDVSDSGTADFTFGDPAVEINKVVSAEDDENSWGDIDGNDSFGYDETFNCPSQGRTNVVDLLGDNPNTPEVETDHVLDTDSASVTVTCGSTPPPPPPPPPPPSDEFMDVRLVKDATTSVQLVNGQATVAYTVRVRNNGPNQAHNVKVMDAAPGGVTFLAVTSQPVNGSCSVTPALLSCSLGTLGPGVERTIGLSARVAQTGTYVNCATTTGEGKDTNGANNMECASTLVTAPVTPPTSNPKPKPKAKPKAKPDLCRVLKVTPKMVKANGESQLVVAKVTRSRNPVKGVKVRFSGSGKAKVVRTNAKGVARYRVKTSKSGIMVVRITSVKACNTARIGVVGVFEPPVTG